MPWRLIGSIVFFTIFLVFIVSNLKPENKCDISFIQWTISQVPVYLTVFASFVLGLFSAVPVIISVHLKKKKEPKGQLQQKKGKKKDGESEEDDDSIDPDSGGN